MNLFHLSATGYFYCGRNAYNEVQRSRMKCHVNDRARVELVFKINVF